MGWPSPAYVRALLMCVQRCVEAAAGPEMLLSEIVALGSPREFPAISLSLGGDETVPRLRAETKLLRVQGPLALMSPAQTALCSTLNEASDLLGLRLDAGGEAQDFFVARRIESGAPLAAMFDGLWAERGWVSYLASSETVEAQPVVVPQFDDDATQPRPRAIDNARPPPDSLDAV